MTPELWARLIPLFHAALEMPPGERREFIERVRAEDAELGRELQALVDAHEKQEHAEDQPPFKVAGVLKPVPHPRFSPGDLIDDRFEVQLLVGSGGMGEVYRAWDRELTQVIALKTIRPELAALPAILARFKKELRLARRIGGPNLCRVYELFVPDAASRHHAFFTMEFLEGSTLDGLIRGSGKLTWQQAQPILEDICAALASMHSAGIVHRDLKSRNIMLVDRGGARQAVVMDFGLAHETASANSGGDTTLTAPGLLLGTPEYMAPEQFECKPVSAATDVYALGILIYEMLTGTRPFSAHDPLNAFMQRAKPLAPPSTIQRGVPRRLDQVVRRCLQYEPAGRYQSIDELRAALPGSSSMHLPAVPSARAFRRSPSVRIALAVLAVAALGLGIYFWIHQNAYHGPGAGAIIWYDRGLTALREGSYLEATNELEEAVRIEPKFPLAHARLADAWSELGFTGNADREMLLASSEHERNLPGLDRQYIEAVRKTLTRDYSGAVQDYTEILDRLPEDQKGFGELDLGRAQANNNDNAGAVRSFRAAAGLRPDNPAPFVQLGILRSGPTDSQTAQDSFNRADQLYKATHNLEGQAEVAFQRGYAANQQGDSAAAETALLQCKQIADEIRSVPMQIRALTQLAYIYDISSKFDQSIATSGHAVQLARENGIDYWAIDALLRMADAYAGKGDYENAEKTAEQALQQTRQSQEGGLTALAETTLASLRERQKKWDEVVPLAQSALGYDSEHGMLGPAIDSATLLARGLIGKGDFAGAQASLKQIFALAEQSKADIDLELAHGTAGLVFYHLRQYPQSLEHYAQADLLSHKRGDSGAPYYLEQRADMLWRLGRYAEADQELRSLDPAVARIPDNAADLDSIRAEMLLSQEKFAQAEALAAQAMHLGKPDSGRTFDLERVEALSESALGRPAKAQETARKLAEDAQRQGDPGLIADANLARAAVLASPDPAQAQAMAGQALGFYKAEGIVESQWRAEELLARIADRQHDASAAHLHARNALDILQKLEQTWSSQVFNQYRTRPDVRHAVNELSGLISPGKV